MADSETRLYGMADPSNNQRPPENGMRGEGAADADGAMPPRAVDLPGEGTVLVEETSGVAYAEAARVDPPAPSAMPLPSSGPDRGSSALPWVLVASVLGFAAGRLQPRAFRVEKRNASPAALARLPGETGGFSQVRDSGPEEMRDPEPDWSEIDEAIDESFPASDPPAWSAPRRDYPAAGQRASSSIAHGASSEGASASGGRAALLGYGLAGAALAALGLSLARGSAMDRNDIGYPPLDQLKPVAPDVWIVDSRPVNAMGLKLPIRMTVVRLQNGDVLLHSPTRHTPALAEAIEGIGPVRHIVAPATGHWMFVEEWQQAFPAATTWAVPVLRERAQVRRSAMRIEIVDQVGQNQHPALLVEQPCLLEPSRAAHQALPYPGAPFARRVVAQYRIDPQGRPTHLRPFAQHRHGPGRRGRKRLLPVLGEHPVAGRRHWPKR